MPPSDADTLNSRSQANRTPISSSLASVSLSRDHITDALAKSPDNGATLDLTHKNLSDVGEDGAEELATIGRGDDMDYESTVIRIALAHNRLATLPMAFALLSRLRYLVLKNNNFTVFPEVLTVMPTLEILDISRNKIKRLPSHPGSLTKLKVFSLMRNKIHKLPTYITEFQQLLILKVDQNPLEWPPRHVMEVSPNADDTVMKGWIDSLQQWIKANSAGLERKMSDDSSFTDPSIEDVNNSLDDSQGSSFFLNDDLIHREWPLHSRSISLESNASIYSDMANLHSPSPSQPTTRFTTRLRTDMLSNTKGANAPSPLRSPATYLPTPEGSIDDELPNNGRGQMSKSQLHGRNASSGLGVNTNVSRHRVFAKKSAPDLRPLNLLDRADPPLSRNGISIPPPLPSPPHRQDSDSSAMSFNRNRILAEDVVSASPIDRPAPPMDVERNSYFRRLSLLPSTSLAKTIPQALLSMVDAVRGILFAVSQVYQTLQHYTVYAIDERLSAVLQKVLDPASIYMQQLINALDRFDTISRRSLPSPAVCRAVLECCRDNVTVFGKAVGVLGLQLKILASHDDVRYTRQMLLNLYGAMGEIAIAWNSISAYADEVKPLLREHRPPPVMTKSYTHPSPTMRGATPSFAESPNAVPMSAPLPMPAHALPRPLLRSNSSRDSLDSLKGRMSRRHAGSFSSKDVEIGKRLPSYVEMPQLSASAVEGSGSSTLRAARRPGVGMSISSGVSNAPHSAGPISGSSMSSRWDSHSRQGSQSSLLAGTPLSVKPPSLDLVSSTSTLVDKEVIEAVKVALDAAPGTWDMISEVLADTPELQDELGEVLDKVRDLTEKLREDIRSLETGNVGEEKRSLRDDGYAFAKTVRDLSNAIKAYGGTLPYSATTRANIVKLMNATQDFVILLHVSSFSPAPTPRPYSPMITPQMSAPTTGEGNVLGSNLSRNRTAASPSPSTLKLVRPQHRELPRSALPSSQTFKIPMPPRFGAVRNRPGENSAVPV
ncbi:RAM signaling pathway protein-domain-containing protein [Abortiporus biennis]|nr:RAM signaling pathway protein-domain-containing protein [Abortiporus biennis]